MKRGYKSWEVIKNTPIEEMNTTQLKLYYKHTGDRETYLDEQARRAAVRSHTRRLRLKRGGMRRKARQIMQEIGERLLLEDEDE